MSVSQHSTPKHLRYGTNVNNVEANCNTSNIDLPLLPDEALNNIISYSLPQKECQVWEWIGRLSQTCRSLRRISQSYAPTRIVLKDFISYCPISGSEGYDARIGFLRSFRDCSWKRQSLKEFHVNPSSVLRSSGDELLACNDIQVLLRTLITTPSSFLKLEWLDIELQSDDVYDYNLIDAESLPLIPDALPTLQKLCLCKCFKDGEEEFNNNTPFSLTQFFLSLHTPLTSLSICGPMWMTDAHVEAIMPIIGENLVRLELVSCVAYNEFGTETRLSDNSLVSIAQHCKQLKSFSMVDSEITKLGLGWVLSANTGITTLNLSASTRLWTPDDSAFDIISKYLPRLKEIRNYWPGGRGRRDWFTDDGLIALVNAQEKESGGSGIFLKLIGVSNCDKFMPQLTIRGMKYAIEKGVREIEIDECKVSSISRRFFARSKTLQGSIVNLGSDVKLYQPHYVHYIDGSLYEREAVGN